MGAACCLAPPPGRDCSVCNPDGTHKRVSMELSSTLQLKDLVQDPHSSELYEVEVTEGGVVYHVPVMGFYWLREMPCAMAGDPCHPCMCVCVCVCANPDSCSCPFVHGHTHTNTYAHVHTNGLVPYTSHTLAPTLTQTHTQSKKCLWRN